MAKETQKKEPEAQTAVNVKIPTSLFRKVKAKVGLTGKKMQEAATEAFKEWVAR